MAGISETSDEQVLELLRARGPLSVAELGAASRVTATAVRQRLVRLMAQGLVQRQVQRAARGRPSHRYQLTDKARRQVGTNFADLAMLLWNELRAVKDPAVRRGLLKRIATGLAEAYRGQVSGETVEQRMSSLRQLFAARRVPMEIERAERPTMGPTLTVVDCPYPELAEQDRGVCAMERMLFAELLDAPLELSQCRLDGHACCQFQTS